MVLYQMDLMKQLQNLGHAVVYLAGGRYDLKKRPYLTRTVIDGIKTVEIVNSPNVYDPYCYRTDPDSHCRDGIIEKMTKETITLEEPDLIHIHDLRMHGASVIDIARGFGLPVIKTLHNFWDFCPKDNLLYKEDSLCEDYADGGKCLECLTRYPDMSIPFSQRVKGTIRSRFFISKLTHIARLTRGMSPRASINGYYPLRFSANSYKRRREYFTRMLNNCDVVHAVSDYSRKKFINYGVNRDIVKTIHLSVKSVSEIIPRPLFFAHYPITFGYRGGINKKKGVHVLLAAFSQLDQQRCKLQIYGYGDMSILKQYSGRKLNVEYMGAYSPDEVKESLKTIDVGVVPSMWEEPFPCVGLEYISARIPIVASKIGGIPEWLQDGENGYLVSPGNVHKLKEAMQRFIDEPKMISKLQRKMKPWKTMRAHAIEISNLYHDLASTKRGKRSL